MGVAGHPDDLPVIARRRKVASACPRPPPRASSAPTVAWSTCRRSSAPGFFGVGLCAVALGIVGLWANATALVGSLYDKDDPRCDARFSIFYVGINLGAFFGPLLTGLAQQRLGFHYGFGLAAIGMAIWLTPVRDRHSGRRTGDCRRHHLFRPAPRPPFGRLGDAGLLGKLRHNRRSRHPVRPSPDDRRPYILRFMSGINWFTRSCAFMRSSKPVDSNT